MRCGAVPGAPGAGRRAVLLALLAGAPSFFGAERARAGELRLVGERHASRGRLGGERFRGWLEVRPDATYRGERVYGDGRREPLGGRARIRGDELVLHPAGDEPERVFGRDDAEQRVRWRWTSGEDTWVLVQPGRTESPLELVLRVVEEGRPLHWIFADNLGAVDRSPEGLILRSRLPSPHDLEELIEERGLRTVVSLNGDLTDEEPLWVPDPRLRSGDRDGLDDLRPRRVNLARFIAERGLRHETFDLSASRAPTDEELVAIFRVLLDDERKPILLHCRGGADRAGVISALYAIEFLGRTKAEAKETMRRHLWAAVDGTEIQGAVVDLYQPGRIRRLLREAGVTIPPRYRRDDRPSLDRPY